jgi:hypothetical protein
MTLALYTFANEAYVPALAALINSARKTGFTGPIHVGSPEPLSIASQDCEYVKFKVLGPSAYWPGNRKAELVLAHPSERFVFLDADMIVNDGTFLQRLERWVEIGPVFAVEALVAQIDYRRYMWAQRLGHISKPDRWPMHYFNSGLFAGILQRDQRLFEAWDDAIRIALTPPCGLFSDPDFPLADQDVLNAVLQDWEPRPIGVSQPDVWSAATQVNPFLPVGTFEYPAVLHCTGADKPWQITRPPSRGPNAYDLAWYEHAIAFPAPVRIEVVVPPLMRSWFEQRPLARFLRGAKGRLRRLLAGT